VASLNKIIIVGNLTSDPETRLAMDGVSVAKFKMTVSSYPGTDQSINFIEVIAWRRLAEVCGQYLKKGKLVLVEGRLQIRAYEDQSGQRKWATEVVASNMQMLDGRPTAASQTQDGAIANSVPKVEEVSGFEEVEELPEDDLPF